jgi:hypothetical protein
MTTRGAVAAAVAVAIVVSVAGWLITRGDNGSREPGTAFRAYAADTDRGGRVFAAVERLDGGHWRAAVARADDAGRTLDPTFADVPLTNPRGVAVQSTGEVLVAGDRLVDGRRRMAVARVEPDGRLDRSFGANGVATIAAGSGDALARGVVGGAGKSAVVAGDARDGGHHVLAVAFLEPDGTGARVDLVPDASAAGAAIDRDGNAIFAGTDTRDGSAVLVRTGARQALTVTRAHTRLTSTAWRAVAAAPDGGAIVVGSGRGPDGRSLIAVQRFVPGGAPGAVAPIPAGEGDAYGRGVVIAPDGRITVGGTGTQGGHPAAFATPLGGTAAVTPAPTLRGPGSLVALLPESTVLANRWDGNLQIAALLR